MNKKTRMEKYANLRRAVELENTMFFIEHPNKWFWLMTHQTLIKKMKGCKH